MKLLKVSALLFLTGCGIGQPHCVPCSSCPGAEWKNWNGCDQAPHQWQGFKWMQDGEPLTGCIPCSKAKDPASRFVCFGEKP